MLMLAIGAFVMWVILGIIAMISEDSGNGGIMLFHGWATTIICMPIVIPCYVIGAVMALCKKYLTKWSVILVDKIKEETKMKVIIVLAFCFVLSLEFVNAMDSMDKGFNWKRIIRGIVYGCLMICFIYLVGDIIWYK